MTARTQPEAEPPSGLRPRVLEGRPSLVVALAAFLFVTVFVVRLLAGDSPDAFSMLYAFPVALIATSFGIRAGSAASLVALALVVVWTLVDHVTLTPLGWASRVLPLLLLGALLGEATDRIRVVEQERRRLAAAALLHREAIEINDSLIQGMAVAKWSFEGGSVDAGLRALDDTMTRAHHLVSDLIRRAEMGDRAEPLADDPPVRART